MSTVLLDSNAEVEERSQGGFVVTTLSGAPHTGAIVNAVVENYHRISGRHKPDADELRARITDPKTPVTVIAHGENMLGAPLVTCWEGKLFESSRGVGQIGILPKGARSKGFRVDPEKVLDVLDGYKLEEARELVRSIRSVYPEVKQLTQERLEELPGEGQCGDMLSLALFGRHQLLGGTDTLWLIGEYWPEDDICDTSVVLIRPEFGTSEHGSSWGREHLGNRSLGEVVGFEPISYGEGIRLCELDFDEAWAELFGKVPA